MTLSIPINSETEARLRLLAEESGVDLPTLVSQLVEQAAGPGEAQGISPQEFDQSLDELFAGDQQALPSSHLTYSRQDIYHDRD